MTNPDDIVRVRARLEGRASVYEANGWAQAYTTGLLSGNGVLPNTVPDMNVLVGGSQDNPDVVIAQNADGYKIALDIVGQQAISLTAPASQNRISSIVAYTDDLSLASTDSATTGSPSSCGLIVVNGNTAILPTPPNDSTIRTAITADGATGSQACYAVIANVYIGSSTTAISSSSIHPNQSNIAGTGVVKADNIDFTTINYFQFPSSGEIAIGTWYDGSTIYRQHFKGTFTTSTSVQNITLINGGVKAVVNAFGQWSPNSIVYNANSFRKWIGSNDVSDAIIRIDIGGANNTLRFGVSATAAYSGETGSYDIVVDYTKTS